MSHEQLPGEAAFVAGRRSFLAGLRPQVALRLSLEQTLELFRRRLGEKIDFALSNNALDLALPLAELPAPVRSPHSSDTDPSWMRRTNMVGINVRTVGDYAGVVKYTLTLPGAIDSIHLLPIWEPGVVESLYGIASWNLNREFFSEEWYRLDPRLDSVEKQLRAVSNLVHATGRTIGMDVIPHTDRFSEAAVGTPRLFEWMRVVDDRIIDHSEGLIGVVEEEIHAWLLTRGTASPEVPAPAEARTLFEMSEAKRLVALFGHPDDLLGRTGRRVKLIEHLKGLGLEPVPATMGIPFRGIEVDPEKTVTDEHGMRWTDFRISEPQAMSRVFSPLARFKLYEDLDDGSDWQIDFSRPRPEVWEYVCRHYAEAQHIGNFDFMRGDMSHVQMRPLGVPTHVDRYYDILAAVKTHIQRVAEAPWFGYFAESFLPPRDVFQYGEELDHLDASLADATLGDLQSTVVGSRDFLQRLRRYLDDLAARSCAPSFCYGTADKDDPRFDEFYRAGNEARTFTALFLPDMPSYVGLGFEIRDVHLRPVENERYTKLFVFKEESDSNVYPSKGRFGDDYIWGENDELFGNLTRIRLLAEELLPEISDATVQWLLAPDATGLRGVAAWTHHLPEGPRYVFVVNYDLDSGSGYFGVPGLDEGVDLVGVFSTVGDLHGPGASVSSNGFFHRIEDLGPGEARVYEVVPAVREWRGPAGATGPRDHSG